jgi:hypothetical protein
MTDAADAWKILVGRAWRGRKCWSRGRVRVDGGVEEKKLCCPEWKPMVVNSKSSGLAAQALMWLMHFWSDDRDRSFVIRSDDTRRSPPRESDRSCRW